MVVLKSQVRIVYMSTRSGDEWVKEGGKGIRYGVICLQVMGTSWRRKGERNQIWRLLQTENQIWRLLQTENIM